MDKDKYIECKNNELENKYVDIDKKVNKNLYRGTFATALCVLPAAFLSFTSLPAAFPVTMLAILAPTVSISKLIKSNNEKRFIDKREEYLDSLSNRDLVRVDNDAISNKLDSVKKKDNFDSKNLDTSNYLSRFSETLCILFAGMSLLIPTMNVLSITAVAALLSSIVSELATIAFNAEHLDNELRIENYMDLNYCSLIDKLEYEQIFNDNIKELSDDKTTNKSKEKSNNEKLVDNYINSLENTNENDISKTIIKKR